MEEWRDIEGYEGLYQVSNYGRVKSVDRTVSHKWKNVGNLVLKGRILKYASLNSGYLIVTLWKDSKQKHYQIHRLVAKVFIPNPNNYDVVHHINHNKCDNRVENLVWMSKGEHQGMHNIESHSKKVYQYTSSGVFIKVWDSLSEVGKYGFNIGHISACCNGKRKTHKGFRWSYIPL